MTGTSFLQQVNTRSEQITQLCYHCHKCTAGCPVAEEMAYGPDRILRMIQLGEKDRVLVSKDIWICASCETCGTRCPNEINIAEVMDALRAIAVEEGYPAPETQAPAFHKLFIDVVGQTGRMHELSLMGLYMLRDRRLLSDMGKGIQMFLKGKMSPLPHLVRERGDVKRIVKESQKQPR